MPDAVATTLDRLLVTLDVMLSAFAQCEVQRGYRLRFDPMNMVVVHYVLAGHGVVHLASGGEAELRPDRMVIVPPGQAQWLASDDGSGLIRETPGDERCADLAADGLVRFTAGPPEGASGPGPAPLGAAEPTPRLVVVCGGIAASYGGGFGLFDTLRLPLAIDAAEAPALRHAFSLMFTELSVPAVGTRALAEALMKQCLILLLRQELARDDGSPLFAALRDARLARAVARVLEQPAAPYTVASLAALAGMSRTSFAGRFQAAYGETPLEFVQRVRLRHAATLLRTTALPVKVIAAAVGYASRSHFSRSFHATHGSDPSGYRQAHAPQIDPGPPDVPGAGGEVWTLG